MSFGQRLKELREKSGMSREELAQKLGVSYWTVSKYETDNRSPDHKTIAKIADIFDISVDFLLGRTGRPGQNEKDKQFFLRAEKLSPEGKKQLWMFLEFVEQEEAKRRAGKQGKNNS